MRLEGEREGFNTLLKGGREGFNTILKGERERWNTRLQGRRDRNNTRIKGDTEKCNTRFVKGREEGRCNTPFKGEKEIETTRGLRDDGRVATCHLREQGRYKKHAV